MSEKFVISAVASKVKGYSGTSGYAYQGTLLGAKRYASKLIFDSDMFLKIEDPDGLVSYRHPKSSIRKKWVDSKLEYFIPKDRPLKTQ